MKNFVVIIIVYYRSTTNIFVRCRDKRNLAPMQNYNGSNCPFFLPCSWIKKLLWRSSISITLKYALPFFPVYCANRFWRTEDVAAKTQNSGIDAPLIPEIEREGICMTAYHRLETLAWRLKQRIKQNKTPREKIFPPGCAATQGFYGVLWRCNLHGTCTGSGVRDFPTAYHFDTEILHLPDVSCTKSPIFFPFLQCNNKIKPRGLFCAAR
jgi:hypothetical protein